MVNDIFLKCDVDCNKLLDFGFKYHKKYYYYSKDILNNSFEVQIIYDNKFQVKVIDKVFNEDYLGYYIKDNCGKFQNKIKEEVNKILIDIKNRCTINKDFILNQSNKLCNYINLKYEVLPEFIFGDGTTGVFRNQYKKWFAIIMYISLNKLNSKLSNEKIEIINIKIDDYDLERLLNIDGIYKAYHMNKKKWVSIRLDDKVNDEELFKLVDKSYLLVNKK